MDIHSNELSKSNDIDQNGYFIYNEDEDIIKYITKPIKEDKYDVEFKNLNRQIISDKKYFRKLSIDKKKSYLSSLKKLNNLNNINIPIKFRVLNSNMNDEFKFIALNYIEKLSKLEPDCNEYNKQEQWIKGLINIPFNNYIHLPVNPVSDIDDKQNFLINTNKILDEAVYGHKEAKLHILQVISKWITNPDSGGNILAIQGPMGNGKTTLVKEGIAKAINRPFSFIALGGASDVSYFNGHGYTYEGSRWGRIVDILKDSKCMNPIIYFDELDKVSDTNKGNEIIHLLTHITDSTQNTLYYDNYFHGIHFYLSKVLFIINKLAPNVRYFGGLKQIIVFV